MSAAGFREVAVRTVTGQTRFPSPEQFVQFLLASGPAAIFGNLRDETLAAVVRDVQEAVGAYVTDDGLVSPSETNIALATK
jgi:hypothetical protein